MPRRVIIPLDGTELAEGALAFIERWENKGDLDVLLISVWEADEAFLGGDPVSRTRVPQVLQCIASNLGSYLSKARERLQSQGIRAQCQLFPGEPSLDLKALAQREAADVIVTGPGGFVGPRCQTPLPRWCQGPCPRRA